MSKAWAERHGAVEAAPYADAEVAYVEDHANGTGPFRLEAYEPGVRTVLVRNADWWGLAKNPHNIDRVVFTAVADPEQRVAALLAGEIDFLHDPPFAELDRLASTPGLRLEQTMEFRTIFFGLDQGSPELRSSNVKGRNPFADRRVRQAVYQAIDIEAIRTGIMRGLAIPAGMIIQPGINGYSPEFDARLPYDPDAAKALLAEAGYPDGFEVAARLPGEPLPQRRRDLPGSRRHAGQVGITVDLAMRPWASTSPRCGSGEPTSTCWAGSRHVRFPQPLRDLFRSGAQYDGTGYANPRVDELIDAIGTDAVTYARDALIEQVWRTVLTDVVDVPLHQQVLVWALRDRLELPIDALDLPRFRLARLGVRRRARAPDPDRPPPKKAARPSRRMC